MNLVGLDVNASRVRAVQGPAGAAAHALPLEDTRRDLPMALSLQHRSLGVGQAGLSLCRELPHLVCDNFLPRLGTPQEWAGGRHRIDATRALAAIFDKLRSPCASAKGVVLALPGYLTREQVERIAPLADKARLFMLGSVPASIALALSAYKTAPWSGLAIVVDADDHALTYSVLASSPGESDPEQRGKNEPPVTTFTLIQAEAHPLPRLGVQTWKARLIDAVADRCVRHSRRDPRDSGPAEQMIFNQLDEVIDACRQDQMVEVVVQGSQWCQNLILRPEDVRAACTALVKQAADELRQIIRGAESDEEEGVKALLVSASAWRLPGLREALQDESSDIPLTQLSADAGCLGAHELAGHFHRGDLPREHLDAVVRCPLAVAPPKAPEKKRRLFRF